MYDQIREDTLYIMLYAAVTMLSLNACCYLLFRQGNAIAKDGNPSLSAAESPDGKAKEWPLYDLKEKKVMIFDEFNIHLEKESERKILDWDRTYFLTKYYCI